MLITCMQKIQQQGILKHFKMYHKHPTKEKIDNILPSSFSVDLMTDSVMRLTGVFNSSKQSSAIITLLGLR